VTLDEMVDALKKIGRYDPRWTLTDEETALAWLEIFQPVPYSVVDEAVTKWAVDSSDNAMIRPGKLLEVCKEVRDRRRRAKERAAEAQQRALEGPKGKVNPPLLQPVESPFLKWEHARKRAGWLEPAPDSLPIINNADKIVDLEAERQRQLRALELLMLNEKLQPEKDGDAA